MNKNKFEFPIDQVELTSSDKGKVFNVSGTYFEYMLYVQPTSDSSGSYSFTAELEETWVPKVENTTQ